MKVFLTGGSGMLGRSILRLSPNLTPDWTIEAPDRTSLDLRDRYAVDDYFSRRAFDLVIHTAAKVGGIRANMADQAGFLADNMAIALNVIGAARSSGVPRLVNLGSSCMYPRNLDRPLREEDILSAPLEPTNEGYALAKIAAAKLCAFVSAQDGLSYRTFIPCNLYGPGDRYDAVNGHLLAAIILKIHGAIATGADEVEIWGDGTVRREFLYVDDLARFILDSADKLDAMPACLNTGSGQDRSVNDYYRIVADVAGYRGHFRHDLSAPVGMTRKLMDSSKARAFGWDPTTSIETGVQEAFRHFDRVSSCSQSSGTNSCRVPR